MTDDRQNRNDYRKIIHVDMDCFYAAVEIRDDPSLAGKPLAVGHDARRGVVATASYEARRYGVHSALPVSKAKSLCPSLVIVPPRFNVYKAVSAQIHEIFREYTDIIEPLSLDEAYLDVTFNKPGIRYARDIAAEIKEKIRSRLSLTASAGVSYCKFLAKIASDWRKPDGLFTIHPARALDFISQVPIEDFWGVGPVTARRMRSLGIVDGATLREAPLSLLIREFGKAGYTFHDFARGIDRREVVVERRRKTVSCETTFEEDISGREEIMEVVGELATDLEGRLSRSGFVGRTFVLKVRYADFSHRSRSYTSTEPFADRQRLVEAASRLLDTLVGPSQPVRLIGIGITDNSLKTKDSDPYPLPTLDFGDDY